MAFRGGGSGGANPTIEVGPDFGDGSDDNTVSCQGELLITNANPTYDVHIVQGEAAFTDSTVSFEPILSCTGDVSELAEVATILVGANTVANDGPDNWTNPNNATGTRQGSEASRVGQLAASTDANLHLTYQDFSGTDLDSFTITTVNLRYDTRQTGTALNNGGLHHEYRIGNSGAWTSLEIFTGNGDNDPKSYDITSAIGGSWANVDAVEVRVRAVLGIGTNLVTCFCDAVELQVVAAKTILV